VFDSVAVVSELTRTTVERMRRSLAMSTTLPSDQVEWLLDEVERLTADREHLEWTIKRLRGPWEDVRAALNEMHHLTDRDRSDPAG
jgi:hypothetical protein